MLSSEVQSGIREEFHRLSEIFLPEERVDLVGGKRVLYAQASISDHGVLDTGTRQVKVFPEPGPSSAAAESFASANLQVFLPHHSTSPLGILGRACAPVDVCGSEPLP